MSISKAWLHADPVTVDQAAFLLCEIEPQNDGVDLSVGPSAPQVRLIKSNLVRAIVGRTLQADHTHNDLIRIDDYSKSLLRRQDLKAWTISLPQPLHPSFLFGGESDDAVKKHGGGRPWKHDWHAFYAEVILRAVKKQLPATRMDLHQAMAQWFSDNYDNTPEDSDLRDRVGRLWKALEARGWPPSGD